MAIVMFTGCTPGASPSESSSDVSQPATSQSGGSTEAAPSFKLGFSYWTFSDPLAAQFKKNFEQACAAYGCEPIAIEWPSLTQDGELVAVEALIQKGCQGVFAFSPTPAMIAECDQAGVLLFSAASAPTGEVANAAAASESYIGCLNANDF
jgi:ABC-type sugar transport system substrate-binding protein